MRLPAVYTYLVFYNERRAKIWKAVSGTLLLVFGLMLLAVPQLLRQVDADCALHLRECVGGVPLRPAIVHMPIGLALVMPLIAFAVAVAIQRGAFARRVWTLVVGLQVTVVASALVATWSGDAAGRAGGGYPRRGVGRAPRGGARDARLGGRRRARRCCCRAVLSRPNREMGAARDGHWNVGRVGDRVPGGPFRRRAGVHERRERDAHDWGERRSVMSKMMPRLALVAAAVLGAGVAHARGGGASPYHANVAQEARDNDNYRRVLFTGDKSQ